MKRVICSKFLLILSVSFTIYSPYDYTHTNLINKMISAGFQYKKQNKGSINEKVILCLVPCIRN